MTVEREDLVDTDTQKPPCAEPETRPRLRKPQYRRRSHLTMTVNPDTINRLAMLTDKYRLPVGQIVDKLVANMARCFGDDGKPKALVCISGEVCRMMRTDVPEVL
jgi:hypothetical protein